MKDLWTRLIGSFDNNNIGFSGKKCTAFLVAVTYCYSHKFINPINLTSVLIVDAGLISALFGINVIDKFKNNPPTE